MGRMKPETKYILENIKKFPDTPSLTLAKKIYKEHPRDFESVESVRSSIRAYRGQRGDAVRKNTVNKEHFRPPGSLNPFKLPDPVEDDFSPFKMSQSRILVISDLHFPYHSVEAITLALKYGKEKKVNGILILGDLLDFAMISRHEREWRQRKPHEEFEVARQFLQVLRTEFPRAMIVFKEGNHCERWEKWLYVKAPELFGDPEYTLETRLRLGELKIQIVKDRRPVQIGKLTMLHGHEMPGGSGGVNPARSTFLKTISSVVVGHYHRTSSHVETAFSGDVISVQSIGCLCTLTPYYMRINKHNHGFAYIDHDIATGEYKMENLKIIKGKVY
jgi:hypothetical protein